jgi:hypothetical protein
VDGGRKLAHFRSLRRALFFLSIFSPPTAATFASLAPSSEGCEMENNHLATFAGLIVFFIVCVPSAEWCRLFWKKSVQEFPPSEREKTRVTQPLLLTQS